MNEISDREFTALSFLINALVRSPSEVEGLTKDLRKAADEIAAPKLKECVEVLRDEIREEFGGRDGGKDKLKKLRRVAERMHQNTSRLKVLTASVLFREVDNAECRAQ
jgi:hypothetical protein